MATERHNKIDYLEFPSNNLEKTKAFYTSVFGWSFTDYGPEYTSFADGRLAGGFYQTGAAITGGGPLTVIFVDDLNEAEQKVKDAGGSIVKEQFSFPGGARFHFADPSGNELAAWHEE